jgi:hypothetical protein
MGLDICLVLRGENMTTTPKSPFSPCKSEDLPFTERYRVDSKGRLAGNLRERLFDQAAKGITPQQAPEVEFHDESFSQLYEEVERIIDDWEKTGMLKEAGIEPIVEKEIYDARAVPKSSARKSHRRSYATWSAVACLALAVGCGVAYHRRADITESLENQLGGIVVSDNFGNNRGVQDMVSYNPGGYNREGCNLADVSGLTDNAGLIENAGLTENAGLADECGCAEEYLFEKSEEEGCLAYCGFEEAGCGYGGKNFFIRYSELPVQERTRSALQPANGVSNEAIYQQSNVPVLLMFRGDELVRSVKPAPADYLMSIVQQEEDCGCGY